MKAFKDAQAGDTLYRVCFSDYSVETLAVDRVEKSKFDGTTLVHYNNGTRGFCFEAYDEDLGKCWLHDTLSYAICTDYDAVDVAIRENSASRSKPKKGRRR